MPSIAGLWEADFNTEKKQQTHQEKDSCPFPFLSPSALPRLARRASQLKIPSLAVGHAGVCFRRPVLRHLSRVAVIVFVLVFVLVVSAIV